MPCRLTPVGEDYEKKKVFGEYYIINDPKDIVLKGIMLKRLSSYSCAHPATRS